MGIICGGGKRSHSQLLPLSACNKTFSLYKFMIWFDRFSVKGGVSFSRPKGRQWLKCLLCPTRWPDCLSGHGIYLSTINYSFYIFRNIFLFHYFSLTILLIDWTLYLWNIWHKLCTMRNTWNIISLVLIAFFLKGNISITK